jgi:hypothetical protein
MVSERGHGNVFVSERPEKGQRKNVSVATWFMKRGDKNALATRWS